MSSHRLAWKSIVERGRPESSCPPGQPSYPPPPAPMKRGAAPMPWLASKRGPTFSSIPSFPFCSYAPQFSAFCRPTPTAFAYSAHSVPPPPPTQLPVPPPPPSRGDFSSESNHYVTTAQVNERIEKNPSCSIRCTPVKGQRENSVTNSHCANQRLSDYTLGRPNPPSHFSYTPLSAANPSFPPPPSTPPPPFVSSPSTEFQQRKTGYPVKPKTGAYCDVCEKVYTTEKRLQQHIEEEHVTCDEEGCTYRSTYYFFSTLLALKFNAECSVDYHDDSSTSPFEEQRRVCSSSHFVGLLCFWESIINSLQETKNWILSRKENFPTKATIELKKMAASTHQREIAIVKKKASRSVLERMLRDAMKSAFGRRLVAKKPESAFIPLLPKMLLTPPTALESISNHPQKDRRKNKRNRPHNTLYTYGPSYTAEPFPICNFFYKSRSCQFGDRCHQSHDIVAYNKWRRAQFMVDALDVPKRPPLLYQLLAPEIQRYESLLLECLQYIVETSFLGVKLPKLTNEMQESLTLHRAKVTKSLAENSTENTTNLETDKDFSLLGRKSNLVAVIGESSNEDLPDTQ
ncbi:hypothetical protein IE077_000203 [Cardiosporidium cionae]|uniref:C3H1-type domain-containing protein n=1 Tax=Cardiosporidium cionae TaxID=476202 RepID=A0ABQ7JCI8_9APIC|nr:hypothetical protein IE077_000203 [Cardiosporidium cionae]|eukprot:KAF8821727.1 hypothetical protein IE077_000203 [Cardiosporidium cionae]